MEVKNVSDNDNAQYTGDEELRNWLESYVVKYPRHTTAVLSRSEFIGVSRSALDAYLARTYFLPIECGGQGTDPRTSGLEAAVRNYRLRVEATERHNLTGAFFETRT